MRESLLFSLVLFEQEAQFERLVAERFIEGMLFVFSGSLSELFTKLSDLFQAFDFLGNKIIRFQDRKAHPNIFRRVEIVVQVQRFPLALKIVEVAAGHTLADDLFDGTLDGHKPNDRYDLLLDLFHQIVGYFLSIKTSRLLSGHAETPALEHIFITLRRTVMKKLFVTAVLSLMLGIVTFAQPAANTAAATATKPAETTAKKASPFRPTKDQITQGQAFLKDKKLYVGEATGKYNDETRAAIKNFQKANSLEENGKFDKATLQKMNIALTEGQGGPAAVKAASTAGSSSASTASTSAAKSGPKKPAPFRANEDQIKAAQKILIDGKMLTGDQTGKLDDPTREGLKKYQEANKLKVTGTLNSATLEKMGVSLTDGQKANVAAQAAYDEANKKN